YQTICKYSSNSRAVRPTINNAKCFVGQDEKVVNKRLSRSPGSRSLYAAPITQRLHPLVLHQSLHAGVAGLSGGPFNPAEEHRLVVLLPHRAVEVRDLALR